jgi:hypothetical protein
LNIFQVKCDDLFLFEESSVIRIMMTRGRVNDGSQESFDTKTIRAPLIISECQYIMSKMLLDPVPSVLYTEESVCHLRLYSKIGTQTSTRPTVLPVQSARIFSQKLAKNSMAYSISFFVSMPTIQGII